MRFGNSALPLCAALIRFHFHCAETGENEPFMPLPKNCELRILFGGQAEC
jgi:hypothetical protein